MVLATCAIFGTEWVAPGTDLGNYDVGILGRRCISVDDVIVLVRSDGAVSGEVAEAFQEADPGIRAVGLLKNGLPRWLVYPEAPKSTSLRMLVISCGRWSAEDF